MSTFFAMVVDSYRELNSKKLFWIVLSLSGVFVIAYASIGFDDKGMSMFFGLKHFENEMLTKGSFMATLLYRGLFTTFIVPIWLAWIATILALISTTTIFPDFVAGGSIDVVLAKPISRVRLFLYKYLASLLFVLLQVSLFCAGVFLCLGVRLDDWEWRIFLAIPIVTVFYSYLFSVNVLFGVWTRSALTALLITLLLWFSLFSVNAAVAIMQQIRTDWVIQLENEEERITEFRTSLAALEGEEDEDARRGRERIQRELASVQEQHDERAEAIEKLDNWYQPIRVGQAVFPKTGETIGLLDRYLRRDTDVNLMDLFTGNVARDESGQFVSTDSSNDREIQRRAEREYAAKSEWYVIGTSLLFEAVVLGLGCFIFVRRDF